MGCGIATKGTRPADRPGVNASCEQSGKARPAASQLVVYFPQLMEDQSILSWIRMPTHATGTARRSHIFASTVTQRRFDEDQSQKWQPERGCR